MSAPFASTSPSTGRTWRYRLIRVREGDEDHHDVRTEGALRRGQELADHRGKDERVRVEAVEPSGITSADARVRARASRRTRRGVLGGGFAVLTVAASVLLARRLTNSSWPLDGVNPLLTAAAASAFLASFFFRARAWRRLFPLEQCPDQGRCLASVGAAAASGTVLPFRLDYLIKVGVLRKLGGVRIGLQVIVLSIVSLGMIDAIAMLPLSISAFSLSGSTLRAPLAIVVAFGVGCCTLLVLGVRLLRLPLIRRSRRLRILTQQVARHTTPQGRRSATGAGFYLLACWSARAFGSAALLAALGLSFSPATALTVICLAAAAGVIPITSGGAVINAGASAAILLALGLGKDIAINFSLASALLLVISALVATLFGLGSSLATSAITRSRQRNLRLLARPPTVITH